jgi:diguanylate cyclase (GGDEF) domain
LIKPVRISLVTSDEALGSQMQLRLHSKGYQVATIKCVEGILGVIYSDPPDLLILDLLEVPNDCFSVVSTLRNDSYFSAIPIIGIMPKQNVDSISWNQLPLDDFVFIPLDFNELFCRISLCLSRLKRIFDNNPLTRLPGNTSVQRAIEDALGKQLSVCYVDIDHFKPFNDVYGFSHGDEVIRMLARIMFNAVRDAGGGFCGHIGGDDFVCIPALDKAEQVCQTIINYFDHIVLDLFDEDTKNKGYFIGTNRKGEIEQVPLLSLSIAIIPMDSPKIRHVAKVGEVAAEIKRMAKEIPKSTYVVDKRKK